MKRFVYIVLSILLLGGGCLFAADWTDVDDVYAWDEPSQASLASRQALQEVEEDVAQTDVEDEFQLQLYDHPQVRIILDQDTIVKAVIHRE